MFSRQDFKGRATFNEPWNSQLKLQTKKRNKIEYQNQKLKASHSKLQTPNLKLGTPNCKLNFKIQKTKIEPQTQNAKLPTQNAKLDSTVRGASRACGSWHETIARC